MHILLVEDHRTVAGNIQTFLEREQYVVSVSYDGNEGLARALTEDCDLLILDINLPGMDGYQICTTLRDNKKTMPILMLTARSTQTEVVRGLNLGADDYLVKPFDLDILLARVKALLRRHKGIVQERTRLLDHVWGNADALMFSNTVDVHIAFLRRKLGKSAIRTIPNKGYMIPADSA